MLVRQGRVQEALEIAFAPLPQWASIHLLLACVRARAIGD